MCKTCRTYDGRLLTDDEAVEGVCLGCGFRYTRCICEIQERIDRRANRHK